MCWNARLADGFAGIPTLIRLHALHCFNITGHVKVAPIHSWKCWFAAAGYFSLKRCGVFPAFSSFVGETQGRNSALTRGGGDPFRRRVWVWRACPQEKGPKKRRKNLEAFPSSDLVWFSCVTRELKYILSPFEPRKPEKGTWKRNCHPSPVSAARFSFVISQRCREKAVYNGNKLRFISVGFVRDSGCEWRLTLHKAGFLNQE